MGGLVSSVRITVTNLRKIGETVPIICIFDTVNLSVMA